MSPKAFSGADRTPGAIVTVVGVGADGWDGLPEASRRTLRSAGVVVGSARQLALLPAALGARTVRWTSPLRPAVAGLVADHANAGLCVLASGDPMWHGIGRTLVEEIGAERVRVLPHPSSISLACAAMGWAVEQTEVVSLVASPVETLLPSCHEGVRLVVLSRDAGTPQAVAELLSANGFGDSALTVLCSLGGADSVRLRAVAGEWDVRVPDPLNVIAVECASDGSARHLGLVPGLADDVFEHDGQISKREIRALTVSALAPAPGELLWDVGGGSGSVGIEWLRAHRTCRAISIEKDRTRSDRIRRNAARLGTSGLQVLTGQAPDALAGLPCPDAVFIGGGLTGEGVVHACWGALRPGGRLVANAVTLESQSALVSWRVALGGDLTQVQIARADAVGTFTGWRPAMPVVQWCVTKTVGAQCEEEL